MTSERITIALDLKKNRIRIHKNTLRRLGKPKRVQLLLNPDKKAIIISCPARSLPESQDEKVIFDKPGTGGTFQLYSLELIRRIRATCPKLESQRLYHIPGKYIPGMNAAYFRMEDSRPAESGKDNSHE